MTRTAPRATGSSREFAIHCRPSRCVHPRVRAPRFRLPSTTFGPMVHRPDEIKVLGPDARTAPVGLNRRRSGYLLGSRQTNRRGIHGKLFVLVAALVGTLAIAVVAGSSSDPRVLPL